MKDVTMVAHRSLHQEPEQSQTPHGTTIAQSYPSAKGSLARVLSRTPWTRAARIFEERVPVIRVINWHGTPGRYRDDFARQVDQLLDRFVGVPARDLESVLRSGPGTRSAALFTFDDGLANNFEVAAPILEARGLTGIFSIPVDFPSITPDAQPSWFVEHVRPVRNDEHRTDEDLVAMSWEDVRALATRGHRICCHSHSHAWMSRKTPSEVLRYEIVDARRALEDRLGGAKVDGFCWPVELDDMCSEGDELVRANYSYALCGGTRPLFAGHDPFRVHRVNLEASWPTEVVELQLSGIIDAKFIVGDALRRALRARRARS